MTELLRWLEDNGSGFTSACVLILVAIAFLIWARQPSALRSHPPSHYNECLKVILAHGGLNDAETMCAPLREKETKGA